MKTEAQFKFRLFIAGRAVNSMHAVANLRAICEAHVPGHHHIEVVDVLNEPQRAFAEKIVMTPTLLILEPPPANRLIGNLSDTPVVLRALGLE